MKRNRQKSNSSCGACSLLMVLNHYFPKKFKLDKKTEMEIYKKLERLPDKSSSQFAMASVAKKNGLSVFVVSKNKCDFFFSKEKYGELGISEDGLEKIRKISDKYYHDAVKNGIKVILKNFSFKEFENVAKENIVILFVEENVFDKNRGDEPHFVVVNMMKGERFIVHDPAFGKRMLVKREKMKKAFDDAYRKYKCKSMVVFRGVNK